MKETPAKKKNTKKGNLKKETISIDAFDGADEKVNTCLGFLRSVFPEDLTQLLFVFGVVCLFAGSHMSWEGSLLVSPPNSQVVFVLAPYAVQFAGVAGYLLWFRPGRKPLNRILAWVWTPAAIALIVEFYFFVYLWIKNPLMQAKGDRFSGAGSMLVLVLQSGPGLHFSLAGLALVTFFVLRLRLGHASLPLALRLPSVCTGDEASWHRLHIVLWVLLGLSEPLAWISEIVMLVFLRVGFIPEVLRKPWLLSGLLYAVGFAIFFLFAFWILGKQGRSALRLALRLPPPESFVLALTLPVCVVFLGSLIHYIFVFVRGVGGASATLLPSFAAYFGFPSSGIFFSRLIPAFYEESIFRGLMQPYFISRYNPLRGLLLAGMLWAAWHADGDFSSRSSDLGALVQFGLRLPMCVAMGLFLGWLTLKTSSIFPATVAHAVYNSFPRLHLAGWNPVQTTLTNLAWVLLVYILFRYWPISENDTRECRAVANMRAAELRGPNS